MVLKLKQLSTFFLRCQFLARERHNLHDDLCLIDPTVKSFDGESLLNALLCGSNEFNDKKIRKNFSVLYQTGPTTPGWPSGAWLPTFLCSKSKEGKQREKRKSFKAETIKRLSPNSKCYCFSNVYCFIVGRLEFKYFSLFHGPSTLKSISPALPNLALICAALHRKVINLRCVLGGIFSYKIQKANLCKWFLRKCICVWCTFKSTCCNKKTYLLQFLQSFYNKTENKNYYYSDLYRTFYKVHLNHSSWVPGSTRDVCFESRVSSIIT